MYQDYEQDFQDVGYYEDLKGLRYAYTQAQARGEYSNNHYTAYRSATKKPLVHPASFVSDDGIKCLPFSFKNWSIGKHFIHSQSAIVIGGLGSLIGVALIAGGILALPSIVPAALFLGIGATLLSVSALGGTAYMLYNAYKVCRLIVDNAKNMYDKLNVEFKSGIGSAGSMALQVGIMVGVAGAIVIGSVIAAMVVAGASVAILPGVTLPLSAIIVGAGLALAAASFVGLGCVPVGDIIATAFNGVKASIDESTPGHRISSTIKGMGNRFLNFVRTNDKSIEDDAKDFNAKYVCTD